MTALDKYLASVKERAAAATAGPWRHDCIRESPQTREYAKYFVDTIKSSWSAGTPYALEEMQRDRNDAEFIAHARTDVDRLVAMVEVARKFIEDACFCEDDDCCACEALAALDRLAGEGGT